MHENLTRKITVCFTVDEDGDSRFRHSGYFNLASLSRGAYGPNAGLKRLISLFHKYQIPITCFIPGEVVERFSDACKMIRDAGWEIGHHGFFHKSPDKLTPELEKEDLEAGLEILHKTLNVKPKGYRSPFLGQTENTYELLIEYGFKYDASECGHDKPYFLNIKGKKLLEIPTKYELIDTPLFYNFAVPVFPPNPVDPKAVESMWKEEFTGMYESGEELYYVHIVHPFCIGHFHRLKILENLILFIKEHSNVNFLTLDEVSKKF